MRVPTKIHTFVSEASHLEVSNHTHFHSPNSI